MAKSQSVQCVQGLFETACIELFQGLNCAVVKILNPDSELEDNTPMAYIDAGSADLEITLQLRVPVAVLALTYPGYDSDDILAVDESKLEDWISELSNQLIGRLKNKLLNYGCKLKIGLPNAFFDTDATELPFADHECSTLFFEVDKELLEISLFMETLNEEFSLTLQQDENAGASEGEIELF